ncbi:MAG TPA: ankyrin repeat domain-containing protein [Sphingomicrobium sp.]|nr:ankyrin repeat domain-containing protein [Sphingomicrobium sp.]
MLNKVKTLVAALAMAAVPVGASAQFTSASLEFLQAVKQRDGGKAQELLRSNGPAVINTRPDGGEPVLHLLVGRRDGDWLGFMLSSGGDANLQNSKGDTALLLAARGGWLEGANTLLRARARVDLANRMGETPLIVAVQQRHPAVVKRLLEAGANPDKTDNATGRSARDYAKEDRRSSELLRLIETIKPAATRPVAGPKL